MLPSTFLFFIFHQLTGWLGFKISLLYPIEELELEAWAIRFSDLIFFSGDYGSKTGVVAHINEVQPVFISDQNSILQLKASNK